MRQSLLTLRLLDVQINEIYYPLLFNEDRYLVLLGGAGSGKSVFSAQKILARCLSEEGHIFLAIRKVSDTLKDSVFKLFTKLLSEQNLLSVVEINKTDKTIKFTNGNEILMKGLDDPEKIKSIAGISGIWIEEATELKEEDFDQLDLRLRGITKNYKQIILSFNPIDERHWLKKRFFDTEINSTTLLKTTYNDNFFIDEDYKKVLEAKANASPNFYRVYKLGEWGKTEVQSPFAYNFNYDNHVGEVRYNPDYPIRFSQDFNVEPMANIAMQIWRDKNGHHVHFFSEYALYGKGTKEMVDGISRQYTRQQLSSCLWTGDATSRKRTVEQTMRGTQHLHSWAIIDNHFSLGKRLQVPRANPSVSSTRELLNFILSLHPDFKFDSSMKLTINELLYTEVDENGDILKKNRDKTEQRADFLDCVRYAVSTWMGDFIDNPNKYLTL